MASGKQLTIIFAFLHIYYCYLENKSIFIHSLMNSQIH